MNCPETCLSQNNTCECGMLAGITEWWQVLLFVIAAAIVLAIVTNYIQKRIKNNKGKEMKTELNSPNIQNDNKENN